MRKLRHCLLGESQQGVTLVEMLVVLAISGVLVTAATAVINQTFTLAPKNDARLLALRQVQNLGYSMSRDAAQAKEVAFPDDPAKLIVLSWQTWPEKVDPDEDDSDYRTVQHEVVYYLNDDNEAIRRHTTVTIITTAYGIEKDNEMVIQETTVAQFIDPDAAKTYCRWDDDELPLIERVIELKVTAKVKVREELYVVESRTYSLKPRPVPGGGT